ncbi:unnamed protein product, partial [Pelagomonas calceolata]
MSSCSSASMSTFSAAMSLSLICAETSPRCPSRSCNLCFISLNIVKLRVGGVALLRSTVRSNGLIAVSLRGDCDRRQVFISWGVAMSHDIFSSSRSQSRRRRGSRVECRQRSALRCVCLKVMCCPLGLESSNAIEQAFWRACRAWLRLPRAFVSRGQPWCPQQAGICAAA